MERKSNSKLFVMVIILMTFTGCSFDSSEKKEENTSVEMNVEKDYLAIGKEIAGNTFEVLGGQLKEQMSIGGAVGALSYCNTQAMPLTDSLSSLYNVNIQRVAMNYRNPLNEAKNQDIDVFHNYSSDLEHGKKPMPQLHVNDKEETVFYAPIILKAQCVVCHGAPKTQIDSTTFVTINQLYPNDLATGFSEGDLRGLWKITFKN